MAGDEGDAAVDTAAAGWVDDGGRRGDVGLSSCSSVGVLSTVARFGVRPAGPGARAAEVGGATRRGHSMCWKLGVQREG